LGLGLGSDAVYPRWRGEHILFDKLAASHCGLSPLARGTPPHIMITPLPSRFIPAGAGNTLLIIDFIDFSPVYPRWRGEHTKTIYLF
ncbi:hypothetical protein CFSAN002065_15318, partial [Salmonella enterica subsp. enterica serovar Heidelberg str. CFSAN002065]